MYLSNPKKVRVVTYGYRHTEVNKVVKIAAEATAVVAYSFGSDYSGVAEG